MIAPRHGGGHTPVYADVEQARILAEARRPPDPATDGTATWSLTTLQRSLRRAPDGLPKVSTYTSWQVLHGAGLSWQRDRSWCTTGRVLGKQKAGVVEMSTAPATWTDSAVQKWTHYTLGGAPPACGGGPGRPALRRCRRR